MNFEMPQITLDIFKLTNRLGFRLDDFGIADIVNKRVNRCDRQSRD